MFLNYGDSVNSPGKVFLPLNDVTSDPKAVAISVKYRRAVHFFGERLKAFKGQ